MTDLSHRENRKRIQFSVASISCVVCTPAFKKSLQRVNGVRDVAQLPMLNKIVVEFDSNVVSETIVKDEILDTAEKAGYKGKVIISK
ncbi:MAG: heavy-metal-associated domain-containing protein [Nitrososphaerota archaeon]|nr:heavy-metal-associated domain-containing protein [Nitrososphaerota archaeon]MDG6921701.1 heavy-metal-associated domain-containing protein [Nitrososphaerota archaeon]